MNKEQLQEIITTTNFDSLIGQIENDWFDCKGEPHQLQNEYGKRELAKDVSSFANYEGGFIFIGVKTKQGTEHFGDEVESLRPFAQNLVDITQYRDVIRSWIYPEICLHPQAQIKLLGAILELSKTKQIFITTHSPYFFKNNAVKNAGLFLFKKNESHNLEVLSIKDKSWQLFPWSPSWGEINYHAYNLPMIEFLDELYGFLHQKYIDESNEEAEAKKRSSLDEFDNYLKIKTTQIRKWTPEKGWETKIEKDVSLQTFIRNKIHHPENNTMQVSNYSDEELESSIQEMIKLCH